MVSEGMVNHSYGICRHPLEASFGAVALMAIWQSMRKWRNVNFNEEAIYIRIAELSFRVG